MDLNDPNAPVIFINFDDSRGPTARIISKADRSEVFKQLHDKIARDPTWQAKVDRLHVVAGRGAPAVLLTDDSLPDGALAHVVIDPHAADTRLLVVSKVGLTDEGFGLARHGLFSYELNNPDPTDRIDMIIWENGRTRITEGERVREFVSNVKTFGRKSSEVSQKLLEQADQASPADFPGLGVGRMVRLEVSTHSLRVTDGGIDSVGTPIRETF